MSFGSFLARFAPMRKINSCAHGGFTAVQLRLLQGQEIQCAACLSHLEQGKFDAEMLNNAVVAWLQGDKSVARGDGGVQAEKLRQEALNLGQKKKTENKEEDEECDKDDEARIAEYLSSFEPIISILPSGTRGKRIPARCNICRTRNFPNGKIIELGKRKLSTMTYFLENHLYSNMRLQNMAKHETIDASLEKVPCEALCVKDAHAGSLFVHHELFGIWARMANFAECASHHYWFDSNLDSWFARSSKCLQETDRQGEGRQTCSACLDLGRPHGAPWQHFRTTGYMFMVAHVI